MPSKHYPDVDANPNLPQIEQEILAGWAREGVFQQSIDAKPASNEFVFYDGPPFANGLPHYGHLLTGFVKDVFARYQTMRGKRVERRFGWDCHGLPAEMGSEKELGISGRQAITHFGIGKFNEHCRTSVMKYTSEWEQYVTRQARWVDFKNDYKTMDTNFMESVLWAFKQLYDKGLVYEAYRVMPYSWAAETPLSNFETKLDNSYREREDKAITVAFELNEAPKGLIEYLRTRGHSIINKICVLAWTTTPWTLPSNLALAVGKDVKYGCVVKNDVCYILSVNSGAKYTKELAEESASGELMPIVAYPFKVEDIIGLSYNPLFPYFANHPNAFKILDGSSFVTDGDGTGIVHMAPGFGEDDQKCCEANGIEVVVPVDGRGRYIAMLRSHLDPNLKPGVEYGLRGIDDGLTPGLKLEGLNVIAQVDGKDEDEPYRPEQLQKFGLANLRIINYLKNHYPDGTNRLIKEEQIKHNYPHCWRTDQPLIYRAMPSWYVEVTKFRDRAVELNQQINWIPEHIRDGQMGHMLATAPDWSISRNRFWGTPIPIWRAKSGKMIAIGSIKELEELSGQKVKDLHRPHIDEIKITKDGEEYTRVEDVFDCWFESGSMPFAQVHYPFENKEWFETHFPADFITEYVGQTRGWFNTLIMLSTALFDKPPFKNCICHGVVLDAETGLKYSKRLKNYKDPLEVINAYGADALRWMMIASPVMRGSDLMVDPDGKFIRDVVRLAIKPIWNAYNFFCLYANADNIVASGQRSVVSENLMDRYILAKCDAAVAKIQTSMDAYDTPSACDAVMQFFEVLNNWYIRRSKERFWSEVKDASKQAAYDTLYTVLVAMCKAAAPLLPLTLDEIYRGLTGEKSVHLADFPITSSCGAQSASAGSMDSAQPLRDSQNDEELIAQMDWVQDVCNAALAIRNNAKIRVRQPLKSVQIVWSEETRMKFAKLSQTNAHLLLDIVRDEVNVKSFIMSDQSSSPLRALADFKLSINSQVLGKRLPEKMKQILPASKKGEWMQKDGVVEIAGEKLLPAEYMLQLEPKPEYAGRAQALSTNDALVILDTTITPELEAEGVARDLVRAIQQARKDAGLHVTDKISLHINASNKIMAALATHGDYIAGQTLCTSLDRSPLSSPLYECEVEMDEAKVKISLAKAA